MPIWEYVKEFPKRQGQLRAFASRVACPAAHPFEARRGSYRAGRESLAGTPELHHGLSDEIQPAAQLRVYQNWDTPSRRSSRVLVARGSLQTGWLTNQSSVQSSSALAALSPDCASSGQIMVRHFPGRDFRPALPRLVPVGASFAESTQIRNVVRPPRSYLSLLVGKNSTITVDLYWRSRTNPACSK
jgi:hypothetical protein